ncbi:MAG: hypothetical protein AAB565_01450, partial [Patescibacteria group bacterium]
MRIFELHFNPPLKDGTSDYFFDNFCYEPKNIYEKRLGSLYIVGEISNLLPHNLGLLKKIAQIIKEKYYVSSHQKPAKSFQEALRAANDFLAKEIAKDNVSWLGNLNLAVLSLTSKDLGNSFSLNLAKVGKIKIISENNGKITNIDKNLDLEGIEPYPLKVFTNIVTGKIVEGNKIAILTSEIFEFLSKEELLNNLFKIDFLEENKIREVLKNKEKEASALKGILFLIDSTKQISEKPRVLTFKKELEKFSLKDALSPFIRIMTGFLKSLRNSFLI